MRQEEDVMKGDLRRIVIDTIILAYQIRKSEVFAWNRNSYLTHVISPQKEFFHVNLVCIGCIGRNVTFTLLLKKTFKIESYARKRIKHECLVRIENSVPRYHCFASLLVMPNSDPQDGIFYPHLTPM